MRAPHLTLLLMRSHRLTRLVLHAMLSLLSPLAALPRGQPELLLLLLLLISHPRAQPRPQARTPPRQQPHYSPPWGHTARARERRLLSHSLLSEHT